ncbi:cytochrome c3 family protein [Desulfobaculum senezii]|jgi:hypothetical protein
MSRTAVLFMGILALVGLCFAPAFAGMEAPQDPITLMVPDGEKATKPPVVFPHANHGDLECTACHHTWDGSSDIMKCKSSGCHDLYPDKKGEQSYYRSYHASTERSCLGCHRIKRKAKEPYGPTSCKQCHAE